MKYVVLIKNKWNDSIKVYPLLFTLDAAEKFVSNQDKTNSVYEICQLTKPIPT